MTPVSPFAICHLLATTQLEAVFMGSLPAINMSFLESLKYRAGRGGSFPLNLSSSHSLHYSYSLVALAGATKRGVPLCGILLPFSVQESISFTGLISS